MPYRLPQISERSREAAKGRPLSVSRIIAAVKSSSIPEGGWTQAEYRSQNGVKLVHDLMKAHRASVTKGMRKLLPDLKQYFDEILEGTIERVEEIARRRGGSGGSRSVKVLMGVTVDGYESMWMSALDDTMRENRLGFVRANENAIRSTMDSSYESTSSLLWTPENRAAERRARVSTAALNGRVSKLGQRLTGVRSTTRGAVNRIVNEAIEGGFTVPETAAWLRSQYPNRAVSQISTIARTEMGQAADEGRKQALKDSGQVTHVSVIGCEAREVSSPTYGGESTCNIEDVPIADMDSLEFHINHTGTIIPSRFAGESKQEDAGAGTYDEDGFPEYDSLTDTNEDIGGTTGARLMVDGKGKKYVVKTANTPDQLLRLENEALADDLYRNLGVRVPEGKLKTTADGTIKITKFVEGTRLDKYLKGATGPQMRKTIKDLQSGFHADALLGNWDVLGADLDNTIVNKAGRAYRIDNGGALLYRAQGAAKGAAFGETPMEFWTMRGYKVPQSGAAGHSTAIFGEWGAEANKFTIFDIADDVSAVNAKRLTDAITDPALRTVMEARVASAKSMAAKVLDFKADQWNAGYTDEVGLGIMQYREAGLTARLPKKIKALSWESSPQAPVSGMSKMRTQDFTDKNWKFIGGGSNNAENFVQEWASAQGGGSWGRQTVAVKHWYTNQRVAVAGKTKRFWAEGYGDTADAKLLWKEMIGNYNLTDKQATQALARYHAMNQEMLANIVIPNSDRKLRCVKLLRTETTEVLDKYWGGENIGKVVKPVRGSLESTSIVKGVSPVGKNLTVQAVPHTRVFGTYLPNNKNHKDMFYGDGENEFVVALEGIPAKYVGHSRDTAVGIAQYGDKGNNAKKWGLDLGHITKLTQ